MAIRLPVRLTDSAANLVLRTVAVVGALAAAATAHAQVAVTANLDTDTVLASVNDGGLGLMFINEAAGDGYNDALVTIDVSGLSLESTAQYYEYGWDNRDDEVGPSQATLTGLTGTFQIRIPDVSIVTLVLASAQLAGDYNGDGVVDAADYTVWRDTLDSATDLRADGNHNDVIDAGDYDVWKLNFGQAAGSGALAAAVPEPTSWCMLAGGNAVGAVPATLPGGLNPDNGPAAVDTPFFEPELISTTG